MKGMQKIKRGKQFTGVVVYALEPASHHKTDPGLLVAIWLATISLTLFASLDKQNFYDLILKNRYGTTLFAYRMEKNCQKHNGQP